MGLLEDMLADAKSDNRTLKDRVGSSVGPLSGQDKTDATDALTSVETDTGTILDPQAVPNIPGTPQGTDLSPGVQSLVQWAATFLDWSSEAVTEANAATPDWQYVADRVYSLNVNKATVQDLVDNGP